MSGWSEVKAEFSDSSSQLNLQYLTYQQFCDTISSVLHKGLWITEKLIKVLFKCQVKKFCTRFKKNLLSLACSTDGLQMCLNSVNEWRDFQKIECDTFDLDFERTCLISYDLPTFGLFISLVVIWVQNFSHISYRLEKNIRTKLRLAY